MRELLAKAPAARAGLRRAVTRARTRRRPRCRRAGARAASGPTRRCSTGSRAADGTHLAIVDGDVRLTIDDLRARSAARRGRAARSAACGPATSSRGSCPNWWEAVVLCWAVWRCGAIASPITPTLRRARGRLHPAPDAARADRVVPHDVPRHRLPGAASRDAGFAGDGARGARRRAAPRCGATRARRRPSSVDDARRDPLDVGHHLRSEGRRAHAPDRCASRPTRSRPRTTCAPASRCCCRCRSRTSPASPTACCCRSRTAITAVLMDMWEPGRALELARTRAHRGDDQHAGVHAHDDRPSRVRRRPTRRRCACSRSAARASRPRWCAKARPRSTAGASARTARPSTRRSRPAGSATTPERDATTDGRLIGAAELRIVDPRRSPTSRPARRASCSRAGPRCSPATSTPRSTPRRSSTAAGSAPATSRRTTASTSRSSTG